MIVPIRDAIAPEPDRPFAKRVAVATGVSTAVILMGAAVALSRTPKHEPPLYTTYNDEPAAAVVASPAELSLVSVELNAYVHSAYLRWTSAFPKRECPTRTLELNHFVPALHAVDPWGTPYQFLCGKQFNVTGVRMRSAGPDHRFDTTDDITR